VSTSKSFEGFEEVLDDINDKCKSGKNIKSNSLPFLLLELAIYQSTQSTLTQLLKEIAIDDVMKSKI